MERKAREAGALSCLADAAYSSDHFRCYEFKARTAGRQLCTVRLPLSRVRQMKALPVCWALLCYLTAVAAAGVCKGWHANVPNRQKDGLADSPASALPGPSGSQLALHVSDRI